MAGMFALSVDSRSRRLDNLKPELTDDYDGINTRDADQPASNHQSKACSPLVKIAQFRSFLAHLERAAESSTGARFCHSSSPNDHSPSFVCYALYHTEHK